MKEIPSSNNQYIIYFYHQNPFAEKKRPFRRIFLDQVSIITTFVNKINKYKNEKSNDFLQVALAGTALSKRTLISNNKTAPACICRSEL